VPQALGNLFIQRHQAVPPIDDEEDDVRLLHRQTNLPFDVFGEIVHVFDADAAGVSQFDLPAVEIDNGGNAIARHPGGGIDNGDTGTGKPVKQRGLAHIGSSNDGDNRNSHSPPSDAVHEASVSL